MDSLSRKEVLERIKICEEKGLFDEHVDPIDYDNIIPVDESFHYIKKGFKEVTKNFLLHTFIVKPFTKKINKELKTVVLGKDNIKNIKNAIVTCNHVNKFDCLVVKHGLKPHRLYITAGYFNNQKGTFGDYMRAGGMMPIPNNHKIMKNFVSAFEKRIKNSYILFYPEQSMWWNYEKIRPFKNGAFHYAVKFNVPIIPTFITFKTLNETDEEGLLKKQFFLHIMKPIYPRQDLEYHENIEYLKQTNYQMCKDKYYDFYNREMIYSFEVKK